MCKIKITIITIAYNAESEIEDTIKSILAQTYSDLEYIIIDGGSNDNTCSIIERYKSYIEEKQIEFRFVSEKDKGISDAFNKGINQATGDVIGLINAGDCLVSGVLEKISGNFNENVDVLYGKTLCIDKKHGLKYLRQIPANLDLARMKYNGLVFTHQSAFVRSSVYQKYGVYDLSFKYIMDTDLFVHFYNEGVRFSYVDSVLVSMLAGGISAKPSGAMLKESIRISKKYGGHPSRRIYFNWVKGNFRFVLVSMMKHCPFLWYQFIGKDRQWNEN